jgi:hypothetical protein
MQQFWLRQQQLLKLKLTENNMKNVLERIQKTIKSEVDKNKLSVSNRS